MCHLLLIVRKRTRDYRNSFRVGAPTPLIGTIALRGRSPVAAANDYNFSARPLTNTHLFAHDSRALFDRLSGATKTTDTIANQNVF